MTCPDCQGELHKTRSKSSTDQMEQMCWTCWDCLMTWFIVPCKRRNKLK